LYAGGLWHSQYLVEHFEDMILDTEESISMLKIQAPGGASELQSGYYIATTKDDDVWGTSWWEQFVILLVRGLKERRHDYLSKMRVTQVIVSAILAGCLWWKSQHNTPQQLQDQVSMASTYMHNRRPPACLHLFNHPCHDL
jgi:hypothetical protein